MRLTVSGLNAYYGSSHVLHDVSFSIDSGEAVALVGRNGAGKSTTLHSIMGIVRRTTGSIRLGDEEIRGRAPHVVARMGLGLVPETRRVFVDLTVLENLQVGVRSSREQAWSIDDMFDLFPLLVKLRARKAGTLSGGEQQLVSIARTVVGNPAVLLLDEPTEGLAPRIVEILEEQLLRLRSFGVTLLLSEQHLPFAAALTDRAYIIERGAIAFSGFTADIAEHPETHAKYLAM